MPSSLNVVYSLHMPLLLLVYCIEHFELASPELHFATMQYLAGQAAVTIMLGYDSTCHSVNVDHSYAGPVCDAESAPHFR